MAHPRRRPALLAVLLLLVVLSSTGCAVVVTGRPSSSVAPLTNAAPGAVEVVGATDGPVDTRARNALADLQTYWTQQFPDVFGGPFTPLRGGFFSVDPNNIDPALYPQGIGCGADPRDVENNAFYCEAQGEPHSDSISYDRSFLGELAQDHGAFIPNLVMAHEFGHAVQARVGAPSSSIGVETQADCFAGSWARWVADGHAEHSRLRKPELDELLRGYFLLRDPVGRSGAAQSAHGSFFDRVSAFQDGFDDGPTACRDDFGPDRVFTQGPFTSDEDFANKGNAPYPTLIDLVDASLPTVWAQAFRDVFDEPFTSPEIRPFHRTAPACSRDRTLDLVFCARDRLVAYDETDLTHPVYDQIGDFAVATAISLPYSLSVRDQLGRSTDDETAMRSSVCLTGWYSAKVFNRQAGRAVISPGDIDESVQFLLTFGTDPDVIPVGDLTGFELVDQFRDGFSTGLSACDVGQ